MNWGDVVLIFSFGAMVGSSAIWLHFLHCRLLRTKHEWYSDPAVADRYPTQAKWALEEEDSRWY